MAERLIIGALCGGGIVFMVRCLFALYKERPGNGVGRAERSLPYSNVNWDLEVEESPSSAVKHAIARTKTPGSNGRGQVSAHT
jgi:hypothetical protein